MLSALPYQSYRRHHDNIETSANIYVDIVWHLLTLQVCANKQIVLILICNKIFDPWVNELRHVRTYCRSSDIIHVSMVTIFNTRFKFNINISQYTFILIFNLFLFNSFKILKTFTFFGKQLQFDCPFSVAIYQIFVMKLFFPRRINKRWIKIK